MRLDLTALDNPGLAAAWTAGRQVWKLHTIHTEQVATYYPASMHRAGLHTGQPMTVTLLIAHTCPGAPVHIPAALATWQPKDARPYLPAPAIATSEEVPF